MQQRKTSTWHFPRAISCPQRARRAPCHRRQIHKYRLSASEAVPRRLQQKDLSRSSPKRAARTTAPITRRRTPLEEAVLSQHPIQVCAIDVTSVDESKNSTNHFVLLGFRTLNEVPEEDRTEWVADRSPLFDEEEIAKLCNNPLNETLTPAHVDTILQHAVLFLKQPVLIVSSSNSAAFDTSLRALGFHQDMSKSERTHLAAAAVPDLADGFLFGDTSSYELVILPVYVPGHYVRLTLYLRP